MTATIPQSTLVTTEARLELLSKVLESQKAIDPLIYSTKEANDIADAIIIATATSKRHAQGLAKALSDASRVNGQKYARMEGFDAAQWILIDCNDIIIHIFQKDTRALYRLEELWA